MSIVYSETFQGDIIATGNVTGAFIFGDGSNLTNLPSGSGTANYAAYFNAFGSLASEQYLSTVRGGTGFNSSASTGVAKVAAGTWSAATIDNNDVSPTAAIARTKLANGTADQVVINSAAGVMTSEAQLSPLRGGTGQNFSASSGIIVVSAGTFSATHNVSLNSVTSDINTNLTLTSQGTGNVVIASGGGSVTYGSAKLIGVTNATPLAQTVEYGGYLQTTNATPTTILSIATSTDTAYSVQFRAAIYGTTSNNTALRGGLFKGKNVTGTLTVSSISSSTSISDFGFFAPAITVSTSGLNITVLATGIAATTINWHLWAEITSIAKA